MKTTITFPSTKSIVLAFAITALSFTGISGSIFGGKNSQAAYAGTSTSTSASVSDQDVMNYLLKIGYKVVFIEPAGDGTQNRVVTLSDKSVLTVVVDAGGIEGIVITEDVGL